MTAVAAPVPIIVTAHAQQRAQRRLRASSSMVHQDVRDALAEGRVTTTTPIGLRRAPWDARYALSACGTRVYVIQERADRRRPDLQVCVVITAIGRSQGWAA